MLWNLMFSQKNCSLETFRKQKLQLSSKQVNRHGNEKEDKNTFSASCHVNSVPHIGCGDIFGTRARWAINWFPLCKENRSVKGEYDAKI